MPISWEAIMIIFLKSYYLSSSNSIEHRLRRTLLLSYHYSTFIMKHVKNIFKLIRTGYWEGSRSKQYVDSYIDWAIAHAPFELLGCE